MRNWEKSPALLARAQTPAGKVGFALLATAAMLPSVGYTAGILGAGIALMSFDPERRRRNLTLTFLAAFVFHFMGNPLVRDWKAASFGVSWILIWAGIISRWQVPLWLPHAATFTLVAALCALNVSGIRPVVMAANIITLSQHTLWRFSYWIKWRQRDSKSPAFEWICTLVPFSGGGGVPVGKGPLYMSRHEAADARALAAAQLSGLKLILLAFTWKAIEHMMANAVFGVKTLWFPWLAVEQARIPHIATILHTPLGYPLWERWLALFVELVRELLELAAFGHLVVGYFRLSGFAIPRNTDSPMLATTILDFWNRYYFYFKELLVDFFFFPVYLRQSGMKPLPRTIIATFVSAFLGNFYFHAFLYAPSLAMGSKAAFYNSVVSRTTYCLLLATGLCLSFWRSFGTKPAQLSFGGRAIRMAGVALFFALLHIWNAAPSEVTLGERTEFFLSLFRSY